MQAHAHPHRGALGPGELRQRSLRLDRGSRRMPGAREGHKERIALDVHNMPTAVRHRLAQDAVMLGQHRAVLVAQLVEQSCGAFDVGEEEGDCAFWEIAERKRGTLLRNHDGPPHADFSVATLRTFIRPRSCSTTHLLE